MRITCIQPPWNLPSESRAVVGRAPAGWPSLPPKKVGDETTYVAPYNWHHTIGVFHTSGMEFIMVYHDLSWFIMVYHDLSLFIMIYRDLSTWTHWRWHLVIPLQLFFFAGPRKNKLIDTDSKKEWDSQPSQPSYGDLTIHPMASSSQWDDELKKLKCSSSHPRPK